VIAASAAAVRAPAVRAAELAAVSLRLYEASGKAIHVPLAPEFGLVVILREVLGTAGSSSVVVPTTKELKELAQLRDGAADVAQALLEMVLQQHQQARNCIKVDA
jgi:carbamoylphosphate synthase large subunit